MEPLDPLALGSACLRLSFLNLQLKITTIVPLRSVSWHRSDGLGFFDSRQHGQHSRFGKHQVANR